MLIQKTLIAFSRGKLGFNQCAPPGILTQNLRLDPEVADIYFEDSNVIKVFSDLVLSFVGQSS